VHIVHVPLQVVDKAAMMKRVSRQFKLIMQPYYRSGKITKDEYKDVMRKAVPAVRYLESCLYICHCQIYVCP